MINNGILALINILTEGQMLKIDKSFYLIHKTLEKFEV